MFNPTKDEVRRYFFETWRKTQANEILTPLEAIVRGWMLQHPEYHAELTDPDAALAADYDIGKGQSNPFLHLSMHLSITEQVSIDQPPGIRAACKQLTARLGEHDAQHAVMECLGEMLWTAQRNGTPPDGSAYIDCVQRRARQ